MDSPLHTLHDYADRVSDHPVLRKQQFYSDEDIGWFAPQGGLPARSDPEARQLACLIHETESNTLFS